MTKKETEGGNKQRRVSAREARRTGSSPSEVRKTLGASRQRKEVPKRASHQERVETPRLGKANPGHKHEARPGSRDFDPKRTSDWT